MAVITSIETQKRRRNRFSVFLDNEFWVGVSLDTLQELHLVDGVELTADQVEALGEEIRVFETLQRAYNYLSYKDRSEEEVRRKLSEVLTRDGLEKEAIDQTIDEVVLRLHDKHLLDDADLTNALVEGCKERKYSRRRANQYLYKKGIDRETISAALDEGYSPEEEVAIAIAIAEERFSAQRRSGGDMQRVAEKTQNFLGQNGFPWDAVRKAIAAASDEDDEEDPDAEL